MFKKYLNLGNTNPILFTSVNSLTISILGEWLVQTIELKYQGKSYDKKIDKNIREKHETTNQIKNDKKVESTIEKNEKFTNYDIDRFKNMTTYRVILYNPLTYVWYTKFLPHLFPAPTGKIP